MWKRYHVLYGLQPLVHNPGMDDLASEKNLFFWRKNGSFQCDEWWNKDKIYRHMHPIKSAGTVFVTSFTIVYNQKVLINIQKDRFSYRVVISLKIYPAQDMWLTQSSGSYCDERKNVNNTFLVFFYEKVKLWLDLKTECL
jgi:hypothetical protein